MCGIMGVLRFGDGIIEDKISRESSIIFGTKLLELSESRGKDATGIVAMFDNGEYYCQKMGVSATEFIARFGTNKDNFENFINTLRNYDGERLRTIIGHCRKKSVGGADNLNNHPIKTGNIFGVHNGTLTNHEEIFKNLDCKRDGSVDSEAIFRLLEHYTVDGAEPFTTDMLKEISKYLNGSFSILATNVNNPYQVISMRDARPAEYCLIKPLNLVLIASEKKFFDKVLWQYNQMVRLFGYSYGMPLKQSDIELKSLSDDSIALFDLTREIIDTTKIEELYDAEKCYKALDRKWKNTTYSKNSYTAGYYHNTQKKKITNRLQKNRGHVWNEYYEKFEKIDEELNEIIEATTIVDLEKEEISTIEDTIENNNKDQLTKEMLDETELSEIMYNAENNLYNFLDEAVDINIIKVKTKEITDIKHNSKHLEHLKKLKKKASEGKNESQDELNATKNALELVKTIDKFSSVDDIAEILNTDKEGINKLSKLSLANRLIITLFIKFYKKGWLDNSEINKNNIKIENIKKSHDNILIKNNKAQKYIQVLKNFIGIFKKNEKFESTIKKEMKNFLELNNVSTNEFKNIFNIGDIRDNKILQVIDIAIGEHNNEGFIK